MWVHFETFHVLWQPTYTSKFYPAQGLLMALGQVVLGRPFWGVWLSVGLMCASITWMLQGWLSPGWALLGGFLAVIRLGTFSYWANSYYGGAVTALGGALVLGALPRLKQEQRPRDALLMGLGFAILANSRPYEGLFFGIPVAAALLVWLWKMKRPDLGRALKRAMAPLLMVLVLTVIAMGYYFWRTTGSPFNTPYLVYEHNYNPVPNFPWQPLKPIPSYRYAQFRNYYLGSALGTYHSYDTVTKLIDMELVKLVLLWSFYLGPVFTVPLLLVPLTLPYGFSWKQISPNTRFLLGVCGAVLVAHMLAIWYAPHYSAAITCAILALVLIAMRNLRAWQWRAKPVGLFLTRAVPAICLLLLALRVAATPLHLPLPSLWPGVGLPTWCSPGPSNQERAAMLAKLRRYPGRQLVIVHYNPGHEASFEEWVYNRADLDSAKVIWAQDMGPAKNEELIKYFKNRHVWLLEADQKPARLLPYSGILATRSSEGAKK